MSARIALGLVVLLSSDVLGTTGCTGSCDDVIVCRTFDLMSWCSESELCTVVPEAGNCPTCHDDEFVISSAPKTITVPVSLVGSERSGLPILIAVLRAGAPLDSTEVTILIDGSEPSCSREDGVNTRSFRCEVPPDSTTIVVTCPSTPVAFTLHMDLSEVICTDEQRVCKL